MARPLVEVKGGARLRRTLKEAGVSLEDLKAAHQRAGDIAKRGAAARVPIRSGALAATIRATGTRTAATIRAGFARVPYAGPIHYGWPARHIEEQPFLTEGAQATEPTWVRVYEAAVDEALAKVEGA